MSWTSPSQEELCRSPVKTVLSVSTWLACTGGSESQVMSLFAWTVSEGLGCHIVVPGKVEILSVNAKWGINTGGGGGGEY